MPRNRLARVLMVVGLFASMVAAAGDADARGARRQAKRRPSTPIERTGGARAARDLELNPLGPDSEAWRKAALVLLEAPDIQVPLCANVLESFSKESSPRHGLFLQQMLFSTMAFMIEQPQRAGDVQAAYLAGIVGALKAYQGVRAVEPAESSPFLDRMLDLQKRGELEAYYQKETAPCLAAAAAASP